MHSSLRADPLFNESPKMDDECEELRRQVAQAVLETRALELQIAAEEAETEWLRFCREHIRIDAIATLMRHHYERRALAIGRLLAVFHNSPPPDPTRDS